MNRKIIHIDMDAFFASVEQRDTPALKGKPVIVGGRPGGRGVVAACSYEARAFGIHSAMPCSRAYRLCPQAIFIRPRLEHYRQISRTIMALFATYTPLVEPLSVDEAFLDVTQNMKQEPSATLLAQRLRAKIYQQTGLTASAGVSYNKFLAKIASGYKKPNAITVIPPEQAKAFIATLPIGKFYGVGRVTEKKMQTLGIQTGADLLRYSRQELTALFGKTGHFFYDIVRGLDQRPVESTRIRKSIGTETTLAEDILTLEQVQTVLEQLAAKLNSALVAKKTGGRTLSLKVRYHDFTTISRSITTNQGFSSTEEIHTALEQLLAGTDAGQRKIRLLGLTISNLFSEAKISRGHQLSLPFPHPAPTQCSAQHPFA